MTITSAKFILSAPTLKECPPPELPEICFAGRSNVGKSSLINFITNKKKLAKTSNVPGKTQQMNYFLIDQSWYLVDLPGYGYAKVPKKESERWGNEIRNYLLNRESLRLVVVVLDLRRKPSELDEDFMLWLAENQIPFALVLTKADKLPKTKRTKAINEINKMQSELNIEVPMEVSSTLEKIGADNVTGLLNDFVSIGMD